MAVFGTALSADVRLKTTGPTAAFNAKLKALAIVRQSGANIYIRDVVPQSNGAPLTGCVVDVNECIASASGVGNYIWGAAATNGITGSNAGNQHHTGGVFKHVNGGASDGNVVYMALFTGVVTEGTNPRHEILLGAYGVPRLEGANTYFRFTTGFAGGASASLAYDVLHKIYVRHNNALTPTRQRVVIDGVQINTGDFALPPNEPNQDLVTFQSMGHSGFHVVQYAFATLGATDAEVEAFMLDPGAHVEDVPGGGGADVTVPTLNGLGTVPSVTSTTATLSWPMASDNVGVTVAQYRVNAGAPIAAASLTGSTATGLTAATTYSFEYRAGDAAGNFSVWSAVFQGTTSAVVTPVYGRGTFVASVNPAGSLPVTATTYQMWCVPALWPGTAAAPANATAQKVAVIIQPSGTYQFTAPGGASVGQPYMLAGGEWNGVGAFSGDCGLFYGAFEA